MNVVDEAELLKLGNKLAELAFNANPRLDFIKGSINRSDVIEAMARMYVNGFKSGLEVARV